MHLTQIRPTVKVVLSSRGENRIYGSFQTFECTNVQYKWKNCKVDNVQTDFVLLRRVAVQYSRQQFGTHRWQVPTLGDSVFLFPLFFQCSPVIYCSGEVIASSECWVQFFFTASCQMLATLAGAECGRRVVVYAGWNGTIFFLVGGPTFSRLRFPPHSTLVDVAVLLCFAILAAGLIVVVVVVVVIVIIIIVVVIVVAAAAATATATVATVATAAVCRRNQARRIIVFHFPFLNDYMIIEFGLRYGYRLRFIDRQASVALATGRPTRALLPVSHKFFCQTSIFRRGCI
ncbi:conserved hypothetical protein [Trichinella spiralis]|uniref:hypothetical protein n=1 Tax=Trichinella spiralis TaxID=6334 RepID=UPI0001EFD3F7|nr:conserved hypothetical protein [Trichinella spiralis]